MAFCPLLTQIGHGPFRSVCPNRYDAPSLVSRDAMRRREFIFGGAATAWSVTAHAQQNERVRRIGVLLPAASDDADFQIWLAAFLQALAQLGWTIGRNMRVDIRWATPNAAKIRQHAAELVALTPDVILTAGTST